MAESKTVSWAVAEKAVLAGDRVTKEAWRNANCNIKFLYRHPTNKDPKKFNVCAEYRRNKTQRFLPSDEDKKATDYIILKKPSAKKTATKEE